MGWDFPWCTTVIVTDCIWALVACAGRLPKIDVLIAPRLLDGIHWEETGAYQLLICKFAAVREARAMTATETVSEGMFYIARRSVDGKMP